MEMWFDVFKTPPTTLWSFLKLSPKEQCLLTLAECYQDNVICMEKGVNQHAEHMGGKNEKI